MPNKRFLLLAVIVFGLTSMGVLSLSGNHAGAQQGARQPFSNSVQQRNEMIRELGAIKALLKEQNALLRAAAKPGARPHRPK